MYVASAPGHPGQGSRREILDDWKEKKKKKKKKKGKKINIRGLRRVRNR